MFLLIQLSCDMPLRMWTPRETGSDSTFCCPLPIKLPRLDCLIRQTVEAFFVYPDGIKKSLPKKTGISPKERFPGSPPCYTSHHKGQAGSPAM